MTLFKSAAFFAMLISFCLPGQTADDKATFTLQYAKLKSAIQAKSTGDVSAICAPGFQSEDVAGNIQSLDQMLLGLAKVMTDPNKQSQTSVVKVTRDGEAAKVEQHYEMTTTKLAPDGEKLSVKLTTMSDDTWIQSGTGWRLAKTITRQMDYAINGALVMHQTHATK